MLNIIKDIFIIQYIAIAEYTYNSLRKFSLSNNFNQIEIEYLLK